MDTPEGRTRGLKFNPGRGQEFPSCTMAPWSRCQGLSWTGSLGPRSGNKNHYTTFIWRKLRTNYVELLSSSWTLIQVTAK